MEHVRPQYDIGVIVGRFQVHELHEGHRDLIQYVCSQHSKVLVILGKSPIPTSQRDPLPYEAREQMIREFAPAVSVTSVTDNGSNARWSAQLDSTINNFGIPGQTGVIYGSRDSFAKHYEGHFPVIELEAPGVYSGTEARQAIAKSLTVNSPDFRAGVIWAAHAKYDTAYQAVDVAVFAGAPFEPKKLLVARKPGEKKYRFIGGFSDPSSDSLEIDARREVSEETGISIEGIKYVGSAIVDDWRYRGSRDCIKTALFKATALGTGAKAADDIEWCSFVPFNNLLATDFVPEHQPLFKMLLEDTL